jgi:uncharacterized protein
MTVDSVRSSPPNNNHVIVLTDHDGERNLMIWVAKPEAESIALALMGGQAPRPLTHDLFKAVIEAAQVRVTQVLVAKLESDIFHARLILDIDGRHVEIDSRASDAIAMALRVKVPIYVDDEVLESAGVRLARYEDEPSVAARPSATADENLDPFRDFINGLDILDELGKD